MHLAMDQINEDASICKFNCGNAILAYEPTITTSYDNETNP